MNLMLMFLTLACALTICCAQCPYSTEEPAVNLRENCTTVTYDKPTNKTYFDDVRFEVFGKTFYTALTGMLIFKENTPRYCWDSSGDYLDFSINFDSKIRNKAAATELVTCRSDGFLTDGKEFCSTPPECSANINQTQNSKFTEHTFIDLNMNDVNALNVSGDIRLLSYNSPTDPRFIYNITSNTSKLLDTDGFLNLCSKYGPCRGGRFLGRNDILYAKGGYSTFFLKKDGRRNTILFVVRHDPRPFVTRAKNAPCPIGDRNFSVCTSSFGTQTVEKLWEQKLPFNKEWLLLFIGVTFSYKNNCLISVLDRSTEELLFNFNGPCGRYADMKRGNWPFRKIGLSTKSMQAPLKMRYHEILMESR